MYLVIIVSKIVCFVFSLFVEILSLTVTDAKEIQFSEDGSWHEEETSVTPSSTIEKTIG